MSQAAVDALTLKVGAAVTAGGFVLGDFLTGGVALPFFNVPISTLGMSAAGSMLAFAYGTPVDSRRKLYGYAIGGTFIGVWAVKILPTWLGWDWYVMDEMQPPIAGFIALLSRWAIPFIIEQVPVILRRIFNMGGTPPPPGAVQ